MSSFIDLQLLAIQVSGAGPVSNSPLYMWGDNTYGQLGDNKAQNYFSWNAIYSGKGSHNFAIRSDSTLWAWGLNTSGQLGDGTTVNKSSPIQIGVSSWTQVSVGASFTLAVDIDSKIYSWGSNKYGQLGDNTTIDKSAPTYVATNSWISVSAGASHSVAIHSDNTIWAWGLNTSGQLGDSTNVNKSTPVQIGLDEYLSVSAGALHTTAIDITYALYVWGDNNLSQLGLSDTISRSSPTQLGSSSYSIVSAGNTHTMAIKSNNSLLGWGSNFYGQLGNNPTLTGNYWTQIADSENHTVALRNDGLLFTWGLNDVGQLGDGTTITRSSPVQIGSNSYVSIDAGLSYSAAIDVNGKLYTWGVNDTYQLGDSTSINRSSPIQIGSPFSWSQVSTSRIHTFAIGKDYELFGWGDNTYGQIGTPGVIATSWTSIAFGTSHALGIRNDGLLYAWGLNNAGQLGISLTTSRSSPVQIGTESWISVTAGDSHSMAIKTDNTLWTWGLGTSGQLGISLTTSRSSPVQVTGSWNSVTAGGVFSLATDTSSLLYGWGLNSSGQLGLNDVIARSSPVQVGTSSYSQISAGTDFTLAIKPDSSLYVWGNNNVGQLAQNDTINRSNPIQVAGSYSVVSAGSSTAYAIDSINKNLYGWGLGNVGQLLAGSPTGYASYYFNGSPSISNMAGVLINAPVLGSTTTALFTVECWAYQTAYDTIGGVILAQAGGLNQDVRLMINNGYPRINWNSTDTDSTIRLSLNTWTHISYVRDTNTTINVYVNGVLGATATYFGGIITTSANAELGSHENETNTTLKTTYLSNLRVTSKIVYTGNFTVPTGPLSLTQAAGTNITEIFNTDVKLLTLQNSTLVDNSLNVYTLTNPAGAWARASAVTFSSTYPGSFTAPATNFSVASIISTSSYTNVSAGSSHVVAQDSTNTLWAWGLNSSGQLGDSTTITRSSPVQLGSYTLISSNNKGTSSVGEAPGAILVWGNNATGQLGINLTTSRSSPVQITTTANSTSYITPVRVGLNSWTLISAGYSHTVGIETDYTLWAWGFGNYGALGTNSTDSRSSPVQVGTSSWIKVATGDQLTIGLDITNVVYGWGLNSSGQLGINLTTNRSSPVQLASSLYFRDISVGSSHAAAITLDNNILYAWGNNLLTQLGNTDTVIAYRSSPTQIYATSSSNDIRFVNLSLYDNSTIAIDNLGNLYGWGDNTYSVFKTPAQYHSWTQIRNGYAHTMAIRSDGSLFTWGLNSSGQLGDSTTITRSSPTQIAATVGATTISTWTAISAGASHSVAIANDSSIYIWGNNTTGQLGIADIISRSEPVQVGLSATKISTGNNFTLVIKSDDTLWTWGQNNSAQLGTGDFIYRSSPIQIGTSSWSQISAGDSHSLALDSNNKLYAWGLNDVGQTANNGSLISWSVISLNLGSGHSAGIRSDGLLFTWGLNSTGQLGNNTTINRSSPIQVGSKTNWQQISLGSSHCGAIDTDNNLYVWGGNSNGQLGLGDRVNRSSPVQLPGSFTKFSGYESSFIIDTLGKLFSFGANTGNALGMLGLGDTINRSSPVQISSLPGTSWIAVSAGSWHVAAITTVNALYTWGNNNAGQLGTNNTVTRSFPSAVVSTPAISWSQVSTGDSSTAAIDTTSLLYIWGKNNFGQLGKGDTINRSSPVQVGDSWTMISINYTSYGIKTDNTLWGWGYNAAGQLGQSNTIYRSSPVQIGSNSYTMVEGSGAISSGTYSLYVFGSNINGLLGLGDTLNRSSPTQVGTSIQTYVITPLIIGNSSFTSVSAGGNHSLAIRTDSGLFAWGGNNAGQLGQNDTINRSSPVQVDSNSWINAASGNDTTIAVRNDNTLWTWGYNIDGALGINDSINRSSPVQISAPPAPTSNIGSVLIGPSGSVSRVILTPGVNIGTGDFTWECWALRNNINSLQCLGTYSASGDNMFRMGAGAVGVGGINWSFASYTYAAGDNTDGNIFAAIDTWFHVAVVRSGSSTNNCSLYINGELIQQATSNVSKIINQIGRYNNANNQEWSGNISNFRISNIARYSGASFTLPTSPFTTDASTVFLAFVNPILPFDLSGNQTIAYGTLTSLTNTYPQYIGGNPQQYSFTSQIAASRHLSAVTNGNNLLYSWGLNTNGQLGNYTTLTKSSPVQVSAVTIVTASSPVLITTGNYSSYYQSSPTQIGSSSWSSVSAGSNHSLGKLINNTVFAWGYNYYGQLGDSTTINRSSPVQIASGSFTNVNAGDNFSSLRKNDNKIYLFGENDVGQIGDLT